MPETYHQMPHQQFCFQLCLFRISLLFHTYSVTVLIFGSSLDEKCQAAKHVYVAHTIEANRNKTKRSFGMIIRGSWHTITRMLSQKFQK